MFAKLIGRLIRPRKEEPDAAAKALALEEAFALVRDGDKHAAITALRAYLENDPFNVAALNDLGACLSEIGDEAGARETFALAYSLDDSYMPAVVNHAKMLTDLRRSEDALPFLEQAKLLDPSFPGTDVVYASLCHHRGQLAQALHFQLRAWLGSFDNLRFANGHLFTGSYADVDEIRTAAEHRFWASTLKPFKVAAPAQRPEPDRRPPGSGPARLRIGYWSPDFRSHSVRYFFRPLFANHDRSRFEIFIYHDFPSKDWQTELIEKDCEHFHEVYQLTHDEVHALITSHRLDILVELAGHTSHNRISLFQERFAPLQVTALGYPPTTGLATIDAKLIDRHISTPDDASYYAEKPLILPNSFWCFDPMEDVPLPKPPPALQNGHVTFSCVGNISKINERILRCWQQILDRVPTSRLLLRSISFDDPVAEGAMADRLKALGIDTARVDLRKPEGGVNFFESYNEIDIILDTYPFNGGTTTCFATYMGVPVITWAGKSLISRMGLSILANLGADDWVAEDAAGYVERAVALAADVAAIAEFKQTARSRFQASPLGNGLRFTREFERACEDRLTEMRTVGVAYQHQIPVLPANEIVKRAYAVFARNPPEAVHRILAHCLAHYPEHGSAHLLLAQLKANEQGFSAAAEHLASRLERLSGRDKAAALISMARYRLLLDETERCVRHLDELAALGPGDRVDALQASLYRACTMAPVQAPPAPAGAPVSLLVLIPCDNVERFEAMQGHMRSGLTTPPGWTIRYLRCSEAQRALAYAEAVARQDIDILVIVQRNVTIHHPDAYLELARQLATADVIGFAGAKAWTHLDWNAEDFAAKAAGYLVHSGERPGHLEIQCFGLDDGALVADLAVLDGSLLAIDRRRCPPMQFDEELVGAEFLMEAYWTHRAQAAGCRLAVHRNLGVFVDQGLMWDVKQRAAGREHLARTLRFDPFSMAEVDHLVLSAPVPSAREAVAVMTTFFSLNTQPTMDAARPETPSPGPGMRTEHA